MMCQPCPAAVLGYMPAPEAVVLDANGRLYGPEAANLRRQVEAQLRRGRRNIVLSMARASKVDAAGMGELVRAYNLTVAAAGTLRVTQADGLVRELLDRVGLLGVLTAGA